ncbi:hypothetical protein SGPA1_60183 [Streptomyces misionensis JCM 4497]
MTPAVTHGTDRRRPPSLVRGDNPHAPHSMYRTALISPDAHLVLPLPPSAHGVPHPGPPHGRRPRDRGPPRVRVLTRRRLARVVLGGGHPDRCGGRPPPDPAAAHHARGAEAVLHTAAEVARLRRPRLPVRHDEGPAGLRQARRG